MLYLDYTPTSYPYTVVFEYKIRSKTTAFLPRWIPVANYGSSTQHATYEVLYDPVTSLNIKQERLDAYNITHIKKPGHQIWEASNIKAVKKEYRSPSFDKLMPLVKCAVSDFTLKGIKGNAGSWQKFGDWMSTNLMADTDELSEETAQFIQKLVKDLPSAEARARAIYKYVQDKVRYISV